MMQNPIQYFLARHYRSILPVSNFIKSIEHAHPIISRHQLLQTTDLIDSDLDDQYGLISLLNIKKIRMNATNAGLDAIEMGSIWGNTDLSKLGFFGDYIRSAPTIRKAIRCFLDVAIHIEYMPFSMKTSEQNGEFLLYFPFKMHESNDCLKTAESIFVKKWSSIFQQLGVDSKKALCFSVTHSKPENKHLYENTNIGKVKYDQKNMGFSIPIQYLERENIQKDKTQHIKAKKICQHFNSLAKGRHEKSSVIQKVYHYMFDILLTDKPPNSVHSNMTSVSKNLYKSESTLRRDLLQHNITFKECLDEIREFLAQSYLKYTHFSVKEIAYRLEYSDTANFRRAFKRWNGLAPDDFRKKYSIYTRDEYSM
ncbi:helix-turn-helix transcriptional regulator [Teredinibacter sp. KSP-S5-2]|uniref:helix-turn-helix transcriptional regulator n=1 Tax=Teredinibacter sp. KSP-S5-2 TaxID=3034506 RepID=UPI002934B9C2|nr:helix-turn-helix transcriptional regulator [Teredinibacter sp. KSP-S5-2]WNO08284.1 helix-turn-helix transcriptional regulator [Teredinibacter sp. KSP-S5-2]